MGRNALDGLGGGGKNKGYEVTGAVTRTRVRGGVSQFKGNKIKGKLRLYLFMGGGQQMMRRKEPKRKISHSKEGGGVRDKDNAMESSRWLGRPEEE